MNEAPTGVRSRDGLVTSALAKAGDVIASLVVDDPDVGQHHALRVTGPNADLLQVNGGFIIVTIETFKGFGSSFDKLIHEAFHE